MVEDAEDAAAKGIYDGAKIRLKTAIEGREQGLARRFENNKAKLM